MRKFFLSLIIGLFALSTAIACSNGNVNSSIKVGSKDFAEQLILGEMYAQVLENQDIPVERKLNLGGTPVAHNGLKTGTIDLYPEYTGTALLTVLKLPVNSDSQQVYDTVAQEYKEQYNLVWLEPSPMNNTQALVMTQERSQQLNISTLSDFVTQAPQLTLIGPPEFKVREDGLPGLKKAYGDFQVKEYKAVDPGLRYQGLVQGQADVAVGFATDGEIQSLNLVLLQDDKNFFPPYPVAPIIRQATLDDNPEIPELLNAVTRQITDEVMQRLNYEVTGKQREPAEVARDFLLEQGLILNE